LCTLIQSAQGMKLTGPSNHRVVTACGQVLEASNTALLPTTKLSVGAREVHVLEGLKPKALLSVKTLADNGYTTIFHPHDQGVTVQGLDDFELTLKSPALLQRVEKGRRAVDSSNRRRTDEQPSTIKQRRCSYERL
jgi:hypothetical protein